MGCHVRRRRPLPAGCWGEMKTRRGKDDNASQGFAQGIQSQDRRCKEMGLSATLFGLEVFLDISNHRYRKTVVTGFALWRTSTQAVPSITGRALEFYSIAKKGMPGLISSPSSFCRVPPALDFSPQTWPLSSISSQLLLQRTIYQHASR